MKKSKLINRLSRELRFARTIRKRDRFLIKQLIKLLAKRDEPFRTAN